MQNEDTDKEYKTRQDVRTGKDIIRTQNTGKKQVRYRQEALKKQAKSTKKHSRCRQEAQEVRKIQTRNTKNTQDTGKKHNKHPRWR